MNECPAFQVLVIVTGISSSSVYKMIFTRNSPYHFEIYSSLIIYEDNLHIRAIKNCWNNETTLKHLRYKPKRQNLGEPSTTILISVFDECKTFHLLSQITVSNGKNRGFMTVGISDFWWFRIFRALKSFETLAGSRMNPLSPEALLVDTNNSVCSGYSWEIFFFEFLHFTNAFH